MCIWMGIHALETTLPDNSLEHTLQRLQSPHAEKLLLTTILTCNTGKAQHVRGGVVSLMLKRRENDLQMVDKKEIANPIGGYPQMIKIAGAAL